MKEYEVLPIFMFISSLLLLKTLLCTCGMGDSMQLGPHFMYFCFFFFNQTYYRDPVFMFFLHYNAENVSRCLVNAKLIQKYNIRSLNFEQDNQIHQQTKLVFQSNLQCSSVKWNTFTLLYLYYTLFSYSHLFNKCFFSYLYTSGLICTHQGLFSITENTHTLFLSLKLFTQSENSSSYFALSFPFNGFLKI